MAVTAQQIAELLVQLVDIPSVTGNEKEIADFVAGRLASRPGELIRSGNGLVWRGPSRRRPLVVLAGHLDTVPPQDNAKARLESGLVHGLGTTDMKAGDAVMLALLEHLDPNALRFDLACVFYDAEEGPAANNGLGRILREQPWLAGAAVAILLEPTDLQVEMGCNGILNVEVRVPGIAAHAARPWMGKNAVGEGVAWLSAITRFPVTSVNVQGLEYRETLQVTTLRAGTARNVVPGEMVANLNYRFPPTMTTKDAIARVRSMVPGEFGFAVVDQAEPGRVCLDRPEVTEFVKRFDARVGGKQGWTDVARFTSVGIPAFNFGPGLAELCHRADEYCPIDNLGVAYEWLAAFLTSEAR